MLVKLQENTYFAYLKELEYVAAVGGMLADNLDGQLCREVYSEDFIQEIRHSNREIAEVINSTKFGGFEFLEFLMYYRDDFTLDKYKQYMLDLPLLDFVYQFFGYEIPKDELQKGIENEEYLSKLYADGVFYVKSYIVLKMIIFHREEVIEKYFKCLESIQTPELVHYLARYEKQIEPLREQIEHALQTQTALEICDELKKYSPKCPEKDFKTFCFVPVFMLPRNEVAYHDGVTHYILYSTQKIAKQEEALTMLKVIADDTRLKIIDYISERSYRNGKILAKYLQLAPSTVSHHMEQLIACGLVKEEKNGNTKIYSIEEKKAQGFIDELKGILMKNK